MEAVHHAKKPTVEIPPRKQLFLQTKGLDSPASPKSNCYDNWDAGEDPYSTDHFRMYEFKVRRCSRSRSHDWTDCPFAHPGEKARRRDPRRFNYSPEICPEFRRGGGGGCCSRGDDCEFAHGVFECWLHPSRYRTEACKDGKRCKRKVCFFAHSPRQLRILPPDAAAGGCCMFCHSAAAVSGSPTSTLLLDSLSQLSSRSPSLSPPVSPAMSRLRSHNHGGLMMSYKDMLNEVMNVRDFSDLRITTTDGELQSLVSSTGPNGYSIMNHPMMGTPYNIGENNLKVNMFNDDSASAPRDGEADPDLGWVEELLM